MLSQRCAALPRRCHPQPSTILGPSSILHTRRTLSTPTRPTLASSARLLRGPSSPRTLGTLATVIHSVGEALTAVHASTGIPWYILVPAAAGVVNLARLPFRPFERRWATRSVKLSVLQQAWHYKARQLEVPAPGVRAAREFGRIRGETGTQTWKVLLPAVAYLPSWLLFSQALRTLVGAGGEAPLDPGLTSGGILWFMDLTAPDPLYALPAMVCASMLYTIVPRSVAGAQELFDPNVKTLGMRLRRIFLLGAPIMIFVARDQPAVIFLFWLSSIWLGRGMMFGLNKFLPPTPKSPWMGKMKVDEWFINGPK